MSVQLLDKTRKINKLLHNNNTSKVVFNDGIVFDRHQIEEMIYGSDYPEHLTGLFELIGVKKPSD